MREFKAALADTGMKVPMATTNLFGDPVFRDGAFTSNDARVRRYALQKTMRAIDLGVELGAETYVFWGGREGVETNAAKDPHEALKWFRDALELPVRVRARRRATTCKFALEPKPNEPRGDIFLPTIGHMLAFIYTLDHPDMVGLNPEVAHEQMAGLDFSHGVAQALEAGKLFHIDLNGQKPGRFDQDLRFGSEDPKAAFFLVKLLEDAKWPGMRHFDSHAYRTEDEDGVWDFARGSMRTYLILKEKVARFNADAEIQELLGELRAARRGDGRARQVHAEAREGAQGRSASTSRDARAGLRVRAARSADDGAPARSALTWPEPLFLGLDVGTSGVKAILVELVGRRRWRSAVDAADARRRRSRAGPSRIRRRGGRPRVASIATCCARDADARVPPSASPGRCTRRCFSTRAATVIRPALLWCDGRTTAECREITRARRRRGAAARLGVQPGARGLHAAQGALAAESRAGRVRAAATVLLAEGLHPLSPDGRARDRAVRRVGRR